MYEQSIFENRTWSYGEWFHCFCVAGSNLDHRLDNNRHGDPEKMGKVRWRVMGCKCARRSDQYHGWECTVTDDECAFLVPNSNLCAEIYGEGPDADKEAVCIERVSDDGN